MARLGLGVLVLGEHSPAAFARMVTASEALGFDGLWLADEKFYRDPFVGLTVAAHHTRRLRLATCVTEPYTRHPALLAMAIASLDEVSGGRAILGIGAGGSGFPAMGVRRARPSRTIAEAVTLIRHLLRGAPVTFEGQTVTFRGGRLHFPARPNLPIYVAARARAMLATAGEVGDGVIIAPYASSRGLRFALAHVAEGARRAGRSLAALDVVARVDVCIADDGAAARQAVKSAIALPLWISYPNLDYLEPLDIPPPPAALLDIIRRRQYDLIPQAAAHVPDVYVQHLAVAGTPSQVAAQVAEIVGTGVTHLIVRPVALAGGDAVGVLRRFIEEVAPVAGLRQAAEERL
ncbi:MAG: LLM class flavin-dependent oxidoreductase [Armatimonadota bacterium]|nr:LLM class flavin-dependent oxidoreductase [Armatimonadota bacterium]